MKIAAFGKKNPNTICLSDGNVEAWYYVSSKVKDYLSKLHKGDEIDIEVTQGDRGKIITFIKQTGSNQFSVPTSETKASSYSSEKKYYGKSPEEQESIKRQAIGHMVSRTLISMQGTVDVNNVCGIIDTLYKKYQEVVG